MSSSPHNRLTEHDYNDDDEEEKKEFEETKQDPDTIEVNNSNNNNNNNNGNTQHSQNNILSRSSSNISSRWISIQEFFNQSHSHTQFQQTHLFMSLLKEIFKELSPQTQICIVLLSVGSMLIFISLPTGMIVGIILLCIGLMGITNIIIQKYLKFAHQRGLISYIKPGMFKNFILNGSIVDIFYEIRNSKLGIPDFLLSQILPLDDPEREMIFEKLPEITRDFVSTEGLIYLTPQAFQNAVLPSHLQRDIDNDNNNNDDDDDFAALSPITGSPHSQQSEEERSLLHGITKNNNNYNNNNDNNNDNDNDEDDYSNHSGFGQPPIISSKLYDTKKEIQSFGEQLLWKNREINAEDDDDVKMKDEDNNNNDKEKRGDPKVATLRYVLQSDLSRNEATTQVRESTSDSSSNPSPQFDDVEEEKKDVINDNLSDPLDDRHNEHNHHNLSLLIPKNDRNTINITKIEEHTAYEYGGQNLSVITSTINDDNNNEDGNNNNNDDEDDGKTEPISWFGQVQKLFGNKMLGENTNLSAKPIIKAVIDTRMKELALQIISYVWKSPFNKITDSQLVVIFICCIGIISYYLTKNKEMRVRFVRNMKYMVIMILFWISILCFIELNVRKKSKLFKSIFDYINKSLFHSKHHKAVRDRKKSHNMRKRSQSMAIFTEKASSRINLMDDIKMRRIRFQDKKSRFSQTLPFIGLRERMKIKKEMNLSPHSGPLSVSSGSSSISTESPLYSSPYNTPKKNKKNKYKRT